MLKTINVLNTYWMNKWVAITASDEPEDYIIGKLDHIEWYVGDDYYLTKTPKMKVIFSEVLEPGDPMESIIDVATFAIKEYSI